MIAREALAFIFSLSAVGGLACAWLWWLHIAPVVDRRLMNLERNLERFEDEEARNQVLKIIPVLRTLRHLGVASALMFSASALQITTWLVLWGTKHELAGADTSIRFLIASLLWMPGVIYFAWAAREFLGRFSWVVWPTTAWFAVASFMLLWWW